MKGRHARNLKFTVEKIYIGVIKEKKMLWIRESEMDFTIYKGSFLEWRGGRDKNDKRDTEWRTEQVASNM